MSVNPIQEKAGWCKHVNSKQPPRGGLFNNERNYYYRYNYLYI